MDKQHNSSSFLEKQEESNKIAPNVWTRLLDSKFLLLIGKPTGDEKSKTKVKETEIFLGQPLEP